MKKIHWVILFFILTFGLILRVWQLNEVPVELFGDEIDVGLQANSILKTGHDYLGNSFPVMFQSFGEYRLPLFIYSAVPFVAMFGLNEWGVRLTGVFWGMLGIIGIFFLGKELLGQKIGLISAFLLAITPWHLQYSRQAGIEAGMLLTFITFATWAFLRGLKNFLWLFISAILFSMSIYVYATSLIFVAIFVIFLFIFYRKKIKNYGFRKLIILGGIIFLILTPFINIYLQGKAGQRFSTISILNDKDINQDIFVRRIQEKDFFPGLFHNKPFIYFQEILKNYLKAFSTDFLFVNGDPNLRQSVGGMGELFVSELVLIILGIYAYLFLSNTKEKKLLSVWLLISPISSSLTKDGGFHASRLILMLVPLTIFASIGFDYLISKSKRKTYKLLFCVLLILSAVNISFYFHKYYIEWPKDSFRFWQSGYKEAIVYIKNHDSSFEKIYFNNTYESALPRFLFWYNYDPELFQKQFKGENQQKDIIPGFDGYNFDGRFYFGRITVLEEDKGFANVLGFKDVYLASQRDEVGTSDWVTFSPRRVKILKTIYDPFKRPIFFIIQKKSGYE